MAADWGDHSPIFLSRVMAQFPSEAEESVFKRVWIEGAIERWHAWRAGTGTLRPDGWPMVFSCDPARFGADSTALAIRQGPIIREITVWRGYDTMQTVGKIFLEMDRVGVGPERYRSVSPAKRSGLGRPPQIVVDIGGGLGAGPADRLNEHAYTREFRYEILPFNGGSKATQPERFANQRASSYWHTRELLERGALALPPDPLLVDELLATQWRPNSHGQVQLEAKDDIRTRLGRSPDKADAVTMAYASDTGYSIGGCLAVTI